VNSEEFAVGLSLSSIVFSKAFEETSKRLEATMNERLYLLKIRLLEIEPEIWRRLVVPGGITLD